MPSYSGEREGAVGRVGRIQTVPTAYSAYGAASHRKRCRFFSPSPPPAVPARLQAALAPLRTPPHSGERAGAVGRVGGSRRGTNDDSAYVGPLCVENTAVEG